MAPVAFERAYFHLKIDYVCRDEHVYISVVLRKDLKRFCGLVTVVWPHDWY
jgi:hypothetical protein